MGYTITTTNGELYHHGILGQKWGVRRYQNPDGSLTAAGRKRRDSEQRERPYDKNVTKDSANNNKNSSYRWVREDLENAKNLSEQSTNLSRSINSAIDRSNKNLKNERLNLDDKTDKELRDAINRELLERQYNQVFNSPQPSKGREFVTNFGQNAMTALEITSASLGIILALKKITGYGK